MLEFFLNLSRQNFRQAPGNPELMRGRLIRPKPALEIPVGPHERLFFADVALTATVDTTVHFVLQIRTPSFSESQVNRRSGNFAEAHQRRLLAEFTVALIQND